MERFIKGESIDAIAIGTGPSFFDWIKTEVIQYRMDGDHEGIPLIYEPKLYGCGIVPNYINGLHSYYYGDSTHMRNVPDPDGPFHPGCKTWAGTRNLQDLKEASREHIKDIPLYPFAEFDIIHGCSSGGMAFSAACLQNDIVAIVGFDALDWEPFLTKENHEQFIRNFSNLIQHWQEKGKKVISLMEKSAFDHLVNEISPKVTN